MDNFELMQSRHSVRSYTDKAIEDDKAELIKKEIEKANAEGGLHMQLVLNEPHAFDSFMARYGKFSGVRNYLALVGKKGAGAQEKLGYYGERVVLAAQSAGLNTCWVGMTYKKIDKAFELGKGEKIHGVIALGYGKTQGMAHTGKKQSDVCDPEGKPEWFMRGVQAALLAPTALNRQGFKFSLNDDGKVAAYMSPGFYRSMDLGIVKYHFELGAGRKFGWAEK